MRWSQVIWGFILGKVCGETESEVVIPACDPAAQIRDPRLVKPVFREVVVGEDAPLDSFAWGVQAVGLPGNLSAFGVGDTLDELLDDLAEGIRALFSAGSVPDELTREIAVTVGDAA